MAGDRNKLFGQSIVDAQGGGINNCCNNLHSGGIEDVSDVDVIDDCNGNERVVVIEGICGASCC